MVPKFLAMIDEDKDICKRSKGKENLVRDNEDFAYHEHALPNTIWRCPYCSLFFYSKAKLNKVSLCVSYVHFPQ